jgi:hypothetical protein
MPNLQLVEERESKLPLLCIYGDEEFLQGQLVREYSKKFRIILISHKKPNFLEDFPEIYFLTYQDATLLPKLEETIDYALVLVAEDKTTTLLHPVMSKFSLDQTRVLFVVTVFSLIKVIDVIREYKSFPHIRFALLGELMVQKEGNQNGQLSKIIDNVISKHEIDLHGDNLSSVYPISVKDAITGILRLMLGNYKNETIHYLFYKTPETILAVSHAIARLDPEIKIKFSDERNNSLTISRDEIKTILTTRLQLHDSYLDSSSEGFDKAFTPILENKEILHDATTPGKVNKSRRLKRKRKLLSTLKFTILSILFGSILFIFINLFFFGMGLFYLRLAVEDIKTDNFKNVEKDARISNYFLTAIKPTTNITFDLIGNIDVFQKAVTSYTFVQKAGELSQITGVTMTKLFKGNFNSEQSLSSITSNLSFLYSEGQRVSLETGNKDISSRLKQTYSKLLSLSEILPTILGFYEDKNYLLLFQNDDELRPTGGFIGSIGDAVVKKGKIQNLTIQDVYELDGQLRNHIEPPFIVRRYLQPHLYLRDSNFYLNFQESASMAALLYNLETGKKPDAVIAIDLEVLREILRITGPIKLQSYNVTVDSDTVSQFIQTTIKDNFFPGSTEKRDILNSLFTQLLLKFTTDSKFYIKAAKLIPDLLEQKDIIISFSDNSIQKAFSANGYAGEYNDARKSSPKSLNDFLYINEANIGANKVNANIYREVNYEAMLEQGRVSSQANLLLTNISPVDTYKTYIQIAVPKGSVLKQITINGVKQTTTPAVTDFKIYEAKNFKPSGKLEVEQYNKDNLTFFAFIATVLPDEKSDIKIDYDNGISKSISTIVNYSLLYIKQPGTKPYKLKTTVDYPEGFIPVNASADAYGKNFLEKEETIKKDFQTQIEIQKASVQK